MKAKQILLAFPPGADDAAKKQIAKRADSLYARIIAGSDFGKLATTFSNDYLTAINGGSMPDFGVGQYEPAFESRVWALAKDGDVTKPFLTSHGYHIVKRVSIVPVVTDPSNKVYEQDLRQRLTLDQRWKLSREVIVNKVIQLAGLKEGQYDRAALWAYTDSLLDRRPLGIGSSISGETIVFKLGDSSLTANNWVGFAQTFRFRSDGSGRKPYEEVMTDFRNAVVFQYYRDHLESFNEEFRYQMNEFTDGNLFFEIMQQEIWNRAHADTSELLSLYNANKNKYNWQPSADAVIFFCSDAAVAKTLYDQLKKNPSKWRMLSEALAEKVVADSSRYEWPQIPNLNKALPTPGMITTPLRSTTDNSASFAYIIKVYPQPASRSFAEARGLVINDYQSLLEEQWLKRLKEKYPVKVDMGVFDSIAK
jgi:peptidyl-prolyl cis-trans isomerase SurA